MESDTSTLPPSPRAARPQPATSEQPTSAVIGAVDASDAGETAALGVADGTASPKPVASHTGETATSTAAEVESNVPPTMGELADLDLLGERIAELSARIQAATYELLCDLREFDRHHGWEGFRSCAHWLNWRTGLDLGAGREKLRVAGALADLNHLSAAMACGRLSYSVVRALTRVATPDNEASLVAIACCATGAQVERMVRAWRQADEEAQPDGEQVRLARRALSTRVGEDGMVVLRARLTPEVGAVVLRALEAALEQVPPDAEGDEAGIAQRRADALGLVAESALAGGLDPGNAGDRFQVTMHVEAETLRTSETARAAADTSAETRALDPIVPEPAALAADAALAWTPAAPAVGRRLPLVAPDGGPATAGPAAPSADAAAERAPIEHPGDLQLAPAVFFLDSGTEPVSPDAGQAVIEQAGGIHVGKEAARRVACDAGLVVLRGAADGGVLDVGRRTRTVPTALRRALEVRDRSHCQFPGCDSRHCDAHHAVHWADGGETKLSNLVLLCRFHHRAVHEEGFQVVADAAGGFQFLRPDGAPLPPVPAVPSWEGAGGPLAPTVARLAASGITIGAHTPTPEWSGESLNVQDALDVLWEPSVRERPATGVSGGAL